MAEVTIETLGARGDGIARVDGLRAFVPFAVPGERWRVRLGARRADGVVCVPLECLAPAARARPACPHFGSCGGCQLQHLPESDYGAWKRRQVIEALARRGLAEVRVELSWIGPPAARRRVRLAFTVGRDEVRLGFRVRSGDMVVDVTDCPVARPEIVALLPALRELLATLDMARPGGEMQLTAGENGLELLLITASAPNLGDRTALAAFAEARDLACLFWRPSDDERSAAVEPVALRRPFRVSFAGIAVEPPPGAFLQASAEAEAAIRAAVRDALGDAGRIADLFAGCGTFALPLAAAGRRIAAVDADRPMLAALAAAAERAGFGGRMSTEVRDLKRAPLAADALAAFDGVILDPPRAGAPAQARALAKAQVPRIAMVSCQPASFARDARTLVDGGYRLLWVRPIDAFLWSAQIELVGALARAISSEAPAGA